ncbi:MAG: hypothetical protein LBT10_07790 [Methanobrevibacter sp.]|jgi:hypothetical protein|nr:hypothetical protein [Methanobrevibacter sp.]
MIICTEKGDTLKGDRIIVEARKIDDVRIIAKIGRHKSQRTVLRDNAICVIDRKFRFVKKEI